MRLVVDSSVFVAAFREQEPNSQDAYRLLSSIEKGAHEAVVPVSVILEVVAAVSRRTQDSELGRRVGMRLLSLSAPVARQMRERAESIVEILDPSIFCKRAV